MLIIILLISSLSCNKKLKKPDKSNPADTTGVVKSDESVVLPMSLEALKSIFKIDYSEDEGQIRESRTIIPLQMHGNVFEYESASNLIRFDL